MKNSTKAVLLSGLVFPGLGHLVLKQYLRGSILIGVALAALAVIVTTATRVALATVDRIERGEVPADMSGMTELAAASVSNADSTLVNYSFIVLIVCWLIGIIDCYRLGLARDKQIN